MPCCGWLKRLTICYCCFYLNEMFLVLQEIRVQRTLNSILLILCFFGTALFFILMSLLRMHYICFTFCDVSDQNGLNSFRCYTILIKNFCRLLCKSMLPTLFITMCAKLKHIHLSSYVEAEKLTSKVNAALW